MTSQALRAAVLLGAILVGRAATADEAAVVAQAREILAQHQGSVVWVSAVAKMSAPGGRTGEQESEAIGTVIDPSGLVVVAEDAFNPFAKIVKQFAGSVTGAASLREVKVDLTQVKIRLADGTEIPAKVALKDPDLGLAFVMPDKPADASKPNPQLPHLQLSETPAVEALDQVISVGRLGKSLDSQATLALGRITAVVKKPRELYCGAPGAEGTPVFTTEGKLLGVTITLAEGVSVVVPASEVLGSAKPALAPEE
ncbi:MAG: trypsin-like peptidase domain-containing protein [Planctomycetaceae bacterium]|nr:trypsin-like peptidase domain-containing protein [Planctomycetaceae bacterium]